MATIKERAEEFARERSCKFCFEDGHCEEFCEGYKNAVFFYEKIATEQDRIARADERERCIKAAQAVVCRVHMCGTGLECCDKKETCGWLKELRKAIMEG